MSWEIIKLFIPIKIALSLEKTRESVLVEQKEQREQKQP
jgi:hypothetical protein